MSNATVYRRYRPPHHDQRLYWTERLDIRARPSDQALHCSAVSVEQLRLELDAQTLGGHLAYDPSESARRLRRSHAD